MAQTMSTPGVYFQELDAFGNAVVAVPTAIPAFIGYTLNTSYNGQDITNQPIQISSLNDFTTIFGGGPQVQFGVGSTVLPAWVAAMQTNVATLATAATTAATATGVTATVTTALNPIIAAIGKAKTTADATAQVAAAQAELKVVNAETPPVPLDVTAATAVLSYANQQNALITEQTDKNMAAYITAQATLATAQAAVKTAGSGVTPAQKQAVIDAQAALVKATQPFTSAQQNAAFVYNNIAYSAAPTTINYRLYASMQLFFDNGGGNCYVYSVGGYDYTQQTIDDTTALQNAITLLIQETEPTMLVIPDAVEVKATNYVPSSTNTYETIYANCYSLQQQMIDHCGTQQNRIAILDIPGGYAEPLLTETTVDAFRNQVTPTLPKFNSYAAAYYPWLNTTINQIDDITYSNIDTSATTSFTTIFDMLVSEFSDSTGAVSTKISPYINAFAPQGVTQLPTAANAATISLDQAHAAMSNQSKSYQLLMNGLLAQVNLMPPSAAMAGLYTTVDNNEGVWVAPANIGVQSVISPSIKIDDDAQADLNVPIDGKSICAIRSFNGRGTLVWGARTLDGNSNDWRYINVRRTMLFIEQSVKDAAFAYVFAPNVASTWIDVQSMISNFLTGLWSQGGLAGSKAENAFTVTVGLGSTMTSDDILNGIMRVSVLVAISHPAEFIEITFEQEMQS